ncbi:MAG TPA: dihydrolipoamide acetyltransferase family protein [Acidimicrobiia bacterium]
MATTVSMPQLGETVTEGTILRWAKQVGDTIAEDEVLVEISTDKVDTEVPSPAAGTVLEILVNEGDTVEVGTALAVIGEAGEESPSADAAESEPAAAESKPEEESSPETDEATAEPMAGQEAEETSATVEEAVAEPTEDEDKGAAADFAQEPAPESALAPESAPARPAPTQEAEVEAFFAEPDETEKKPHLLSPVVRRLIRENELDVSQLSGTGEGGRITRKDVEAFLESGPPATGVPETATEAKPEPAPAAEPQPIVEPAPVAEPAPAATPAPAAAAATSDSGEVELPRIRIRTAENMVKAKQTAAHVWTSVEVDFERVERVRQTHKEQFKIEEGFSLTYLPFIARAVIDALREYPVVNSSFFLEEKKAVFHKNVDLGIAVDLNQGGLVVPRIRDADALRLVGIARSIKEVADKARNGQAGVDDLTGSTFTITNPGPFGSYLSVPIINVPNVAILSTETITKRATVVTAADGQDMIAIRHIGYLGLTWDHRAFDGSTAVLFLQRIKQNLETWDWDQELA